MCLCSRKTKLKIIVSTRRVIVLSEIRRFESVVNTLRSTDEQKKKNNEYSNYFSVPLTPRPIPNIIPPNGNSTNSTTALPEAEQVIIYSHLLLKLLNIGSN